MEGWGGFTGRLVSRESAKPQGVEPAYVMKPFDVKLEYRGKSWLTLPLEIGHNEIGDADNPDMVFSTEAAEVFAALGLPEPGPMPCMRLEHQIAQKLHAVSGPYSERAHDLVDLQIIVQNGQIDYQIVNRTCKRLFAYRKQQPWSPEIIQGRGWGELYDAQAQGLNVLPNVGEAIAWANDLIRAIDAVN